MIAKLLGSIAKSVPLGVSTDRLEITPDDDTDLTKAVRAIMVETEGKVAYISLEGTECISNTLSPKQMYLIGATRILDTGTTATGIGGYC